MNATEWAHANELYGIDRRQARRIRRRDSRRPMWGLADAPQSCSACPCKVFAWNLENHTLKTDKPYTCTCGHAAMQHTYLAPSNRKGTK